MKIIYQGLFLCDSSMQIILRSFNYDKHYLSNMGSKRNSISSLNFRGKPQADSVKSELKGLKPLPDPVSIKEALFTLLIDIFRKILFFNTNIKIGIYLASLFLSFVFDFTPVPKSYLSRSDNLLNLYFVKIGWLWTLLLTTPFVYLTSFTYCCGNKKLVCTHLSRLFIATSVWFIFTKSFSFIEEEFGKCSLYSATREGKQNCIRKGYFWYSLDISGHVFILIWSTLVITEEARAIIGWNQVKDMIQKEEHLRLTNEIDVDSKLRFLSDREFQILKSSYDKFSPYVKGLFVALCSLTVLWDLMVITTILYFHIMIEKLLGGMLAVLMWYITYKYWYPKLKIPPTLPGEGSFKYMVVKQNFTKPKVFTLSSPSSGPSKTGHR